MKPRHITFSISPQQVNQYNQQCQSRNQLPHLHNPTDHSVQPPFSSLPRISHNLAATLPSVLQPLPLLRPLLHQLVSAIHELLHWTHSIHHWLNVLVLVPRLVFHHSVANVECALLVEIPVFKGIRVRFTGTVSRAFLGFLKRGGFGAVR